MGGTFTDLVEVRDGAVYVAKVPSTPSSPDVGAVNAVDAAGINLATVTELVHGFTVATNAVLERKGGWEARRSPSLSILWGSVLGESARSKT